VREGSPSRRGRKRVVSWSSERGIKRGIYRKQQRDAEQVGIARRTMRLRSDGPIYEDKKAELGDTTGKKTCQGISGRSTMAGKVREQDANGG